MYPMAQENQSVKLESSKENKNATSPSKSVQKTQLGGIGLSLERHKTGEFTVKALAPNSPALLCGKIRVPTGQASLSSFIFS
jgi:C-terminal processing protease CtpA/Prc